MDSTAHSGLIERFRAKAALLRRISYCVLGLITLLLIIGIGLFAAADEITRWKSAKAERELHERLSESLKTLEPYLNKHAPAFEKLLSEANRGASEYRIMIEETAAATRTSDVGKTAKETSAKFIKFLSEIEQRLQKLEDVAPAGGIEERRRTTQAVGEILAVTKAMGNESVETLQRARAMFSALEAMAAQAKVSLMSAQASLDEAKTLLANYNKYVSNRIESLSDSRGALTQDIITSAVTRIGALLILFFLVQILVNLYRYNTRLSAFYDSRADALELCDPTDKDSLEKFVAALAPDGIDFGQGPKTPSEQLTELAKMAVRRKSE